jgi:hypothetical protein
MSGEDEPTEDWRTNLLKARLDTAVTRAETALENLGARSGNPLSGPLESIEGGAWESPSYQRTKLIGDLDGAGDAIKSAFDNAVTDLSSARDSEPAEIDVENDEANAWKTSHSSIDSRSGLYPPPGGYGPY